MSELNHRVIEKTALFLYKGGKNASEEECVSASNFLEFLALPEVEEGMEDVEDYTIDYMEKWLLTMYKNKTANSHQK